MALRNNRFNAQGHAAGIFAGGAEAWAVKRLHLNRNMYAGQGGIDDKSGIPNGYNTGAYLLPLKAGGMSSYNPAILNLVSVSSDAKMGQNGTASATLTLVNTNAQADQIVPMIVSDTLAISNTDAQMSAGVQAQASSTLSISSNASLGGIIPVTASSVCAITPSVVMTAKAFMEAEAGGPTPLSPEGLAQALWETDITTYTIPGTAGYALDNSSGGGGGGATAGDVEDARDAVLAEVRKKLATSTFIALK